MINENNGRKETNTSFKITERGGISSAGGFGAIDGLKYAGIQVRKTDENQKRMF